MTRRFFNLLPAIVFLVALTHAARAADWPQWRGPARDGHIPKEAVPEAWPKDLTQQWKIEVGAGHSSPVVAGDRVFVLSRLKDDEVVRAVNLADGKELWSQHYPAPFKLSPYAITHGRGPKSTPVVAGDRLFTLGIGGILSGWDTKTGKQLWQHDFGKKYTKTSFLFYGHAVSPVVDGDRVIVHVGAYGEGALAAFDLKTGKILWQWQGDGPAYASPMIVQSNGTRQVITQSHNSNIGVNAADGSLLWSIEYKTDYDQNIITPVIAGDLVIFGGLDKPTEAYRLTESAGKWSCKRVWENPDLSLYMSTPVVVNDRLVGLGHKKKGQFVCLDVASGKTLWASDGRMGDYATILVAGDTALAQTNAGEIIVFKPAADRFTPLARYKVSDRSTWAHPAVVGKQILIKDDSALAAWTW